MELELVEQHRSHVDDADARLRLGIFDAELPGCEVDVSPAQAGQLSDPEAARIIVAISAR